MNKIAMAVGAAVMSLSAVAQAELSANIGATSNYVWRGMTQAGDEAAISGGVDYAADSGLYAGTWVSSLGGSGEEMDFYAGFGGEASGVGYDLGVIYYAYPSATNADFTEVYGSVTFSVLTAGLAYTVDKEANTGNDNDLYYYLSASTDLSDGWSLGGTIGNTDFDAGGSVAHGQIDITKSAGDMGDFTFSVSLADGSGGVVVDEDPIPFVSWSKSF